MKRDKERHRMIFDDGTQIFHATGNIDDWCVYRREPNGRESVPKDVDYFGELKQLAERCGVDKVYGDFVKIYDKTSKDFDKSIAITVQEIADTYGEKWLEVEKLLSTLYMAMVSEFNYKNTKMNKRLKRLGVHQLLFEGYSPDMAANFSRKKTVEELKKLCEARGF